VSTEQRTRRDKDLGVTEKKTIREARIWWKQRRKPENQKREGFGIWG